MLDAGFLVAVAAVLAAIGAARGRRWALLGALAAPVLVWQLGRSRTLVLAPVVRRGPDVPAVALTLDDGPTDAYTNHVLDLLDAEGARATFFVTGAELAERPALGEAIVRRGHELANHSWSHERMWFRSSDWMRREIEDTDRRIRAAGQQGPILFRPPYGKKLVALPLELRRQGRGIALWDLEPDAEDVDAEEMARRTLAEVRPGSVILLHVMYASREASRQALAILLPALRERGYRVVGLSELLGSPAHLAE